MENQEQSKISELTFEEAYKELETLADKMQKGDVPLDVLVSCYNRSKELETHCQNLLSKAEAVLTKV